MGVKKGERSPQTGEIELAQEELRRSWPEIEKQPTEEEREDAFFAFVEQLRDTEEANALRVIQRYPEQFPMIELEEEWSESFLVSFDPMD